VKIAIIGPTLLAKKGLKGILEDGKDEVVGVFTLDDESMKKKARSVYFEEICTEYNVPLFKTDDINSPDTVKLMQNISPDVIFELGHSQIIKSDILSIPSKGVIGIHASILPKNRGGASLNWAIIKGEKDWGVSLYYLTEHVDDGKVIDQEGFKIEYEDDIVSAHAKADDVSVRLVLRNLKNIREDFVHCITQDLTQVSYTKRRTPEDGLIDWEKSAEELYNWIRALTKPFPGAFTYIGKDKVTILKSRVLDETSDAIPGTVLESKEDILKVVTSSGVLEITDYECDCKINKNDILGIKEFDEIKRWLLYSGLQNIGVGTGFDGGFNSWYNMDNKDYLYVYSEITGYGITTLLFLDNIYQNNLYLERAKLAADWIIEHAMHESGGVLARKFFIKDQANDNYSFEKGVIFTFDTGMVLFGMTELYKKTQDQKILDACIKLADFHLDMKNSRGGMYAYLNPHTGEKGDIDDKWSNQTGAFHAKCAMGVLDTYLITKDEKYREYAIALCDHALSYQNADGRFVTHRKEDATLQHPHCYTAEGLLYCGTKLKRDDYIQAAKKATEWSISTQLKNGGIPQLYFPDQGLIAQERTDILGQVLRLSAFFSKEDAFIPKEKQEKLFNRLMEFKNNKKEQFGGIYYGFEQDGKKFNDINSWCSMFALQAAWFFLKDYKLTVDYII